MTDLEAFTAATIEALYFTDTGDTDQPSADAKLDSDLRLDIEADCRSFWRRFGCYVDAADCDRGNGTHSKAAQAGHDFWLTRNGQGAGFWDGDWPKAAGKRLTKSSKTFGETTLYVGDDGKIHS